MTETPLERLIQSLRVTARTGQYPLPPTEQPGYMFAGRPVVVDSLTLENAAYQLEALSSRPQAGGWQTVPTVATKEMCDAGGEAFLAGVVEHEPGHLSGVKRPFQKYYQAMLAAAPVAPQAGGEGPKSSVEYHQQRGAAWDIIDQAILTYDAWMLDDDYDATRVLREIVSTMKDRRALYGASPPPADEPKGDVRKALKDCRAFLNANPSGIHEFHGNRVSDLIRQMDAALSTPSQDEGEPLSDWEVQAAKDSAEFKQWYAEGELRRALEELLAADVSLRDRNRPEYQEILKRAREALSRSPEE